MEIEARIQTLLPLIGMMARERTRDQPSLYDDCRQEGLITAWTVLQKRPDAPNQYVNAAIRKAVGNVVRGRPFFGAESHRGRQDANDVADPVDFSSTTDQRVHQSDWKVELSFLSIEITPAIRSALLLLERDDRQLVFMRYWLDQGFAEVATVLKRPEGTLSRRWTEVVRPKLRSELLHLV